MFRVEWLQQATDELANVWVQADSGLRREITQALPPSTRNCRPTPTGRANLGAGGSGCSLLIHSPLSSR
jgi:hypothetical protein